MGGAGKGPGLCIIQVLQVYERAYRLYVVTYKIYQMLHSWVGAFKIDRAVVDCNRSVNLPFDMRKILCIYPRKRKDIRGLQMFQIGDLSSFLAGGLTCIRCGDLFVSWSGFSKALVEKTRIHKAFWWTILFQSSSILEAKARIVVWHWTKSLLTKRG